MKYYLQSLKGQQGIPTFETDGILVYTFPLRCKYIQDAHACI
jgi:hypothetical protein